MTTSPEIEVGGRLVLSRDQLLALGRAAQGDTADLPAALGHRGLVDADGRPVRAVEPTAAAIARPLATVDITTVRAAGPRAGRIWVGEHRAVLHPGDGGEAAVVSVGRPLLPQLLVRTLRLGPRPRVDLPSFTATGEQVAEAVQGSGTPPWAGGAAIEHAALWRVRWGAGPERAGDVTVLDLRTSGYWRPEGGPTRGLGWTPTDGLAVWAKLGALFGACLTDTPVRDD